MWTWKVIVHSPLFVILREKYVDEYFLYILHTHFFCWIVTAEELISSRSESWFKLWGNCSEGCRDIATFLSWILVSLLKFALTWPRLTTVEPDRRSFRWLWWFYPTLDWRLRRSNFYLNSLLSVMSLFEEWAGVSCSTAIRMCWEAAAKDDQMQICLSNSWPRDGLENTLMLRIMNI